AERLHSGSVAPLGRTSRGRRAGALLHARARAVRSVLDEGPMRYRVVSPADRMTRSALRLAGVLVVFAASPGAQPQRAPIQHQLTFGPSHPTGISRVGDIVGWRVTRGPTAPAYAYKWTIRRNNAVVLKEGKLDLSNGRDTVEVAADEPGMIYVAIDAYGDAGRFEGGNTGRNTGFYAVGAAVAPAKIALSTARPADFDSFWDGKLVAQSKVPIDAALTPVDSAVPGVEMHLFQLDALGSKAHGYVARPAREERFPAVIQLQYAGVYALNAAAAATRPADAWLIL